MLQRRRETISEHAHTVLGDGDDIHMTDSFEENVENSSTIANASCIDEVSPKIIMCLSTKTQKITVKKVADDVDRVGDEEETEDNEEEWVKQVRFPLEAINNAFRHLRENHRIFPWRIMKKPRVVAFIPPPSLSSIREYHEMIEEEEEGLTQEADSATTKSVRSSRKNVRTGRTMMVRQNAQVFGRPSAAQAKWDLSTSLSSSESSSSRGFERQRSVTLENASCSGFSDITEDTSFNRVRNIDSSLLRKQVVFVNPEEAHLGETYCIKESEESESEDDSNVYPPRLRRYDFRRLQEDVSLLIDGQDEFPSPRQRIFSDSDVVFETHRQEKLSELDREISNSSGSNVSKHCESSSDYFDVAFVGHQLERNRRLVGRGYEISMTGHRAISGVFREARPRTRSDSFLSDAFANNFGGNRQNWYYEIDEPRERHDGEESNVSSHFPFEFDARDDFLEPRSRTHSDSLIPIRDPCHPPTRSELSGSSGSEIILSQKVRSRTRSLEDGRTPSLQNEFIRIFQSDSPMASHARRLSMALLQQRLEPQRAKSESTNSLFAAVSSVSSSQRSDNDTNWESTESREAPPMNPGIPSPTTLTEANAIVDAIGPSPSSSVAHVPHLRSSRAQKYYWGENSEDENEDDLWSSQSFDEDLFH
jgi:hypothetical protein